MVVDIVDLLDARTLLSPRGDIINITTQQLNLCRLRDFQYERRVRGVDKILPHRLFPSTSGRYESKHGRHPIQTISTTENQWHLYRQIDGKGYLGHLHGMTRKLDIRITIDGIDQLTYLQRSQDYLDMLWGFWTRRGNNVEGFYYYSDFGIQSPYYLFNFVRGCVPFETQLKIEYRNTQKFRTHRLSMDYIMQSELEAFS